MPRARTKGAGIFSSPISKFCKLRCVCAPQYLSEGTSIVPMESLSVRVLVAGVAAFLLNMANMVPFFENATIITPKIQKKRWFGLLFQTCFRGPHPVRRRYCAYRGNFRGPKPKRSGEAPRSLQKLAKPNFPARRLVLWLT